MEQAGNTPAIKTGFNRFDEALGGGLRGGRLYAIGAISSLGKTSFALNIADNIASAGRDVLIFSLEMSAKELFAKSLSRETYKISNGELAKTALQLTDHLRKYQRDEQEIIDRAIENYRETSAKHMNISEGVGNIGVSQIRESISARIQTGEHKPVVIVDYMQILAPYNEKMTDKQNTDKNITELKRISRDYDIPVIIISSFNRDSYLNEVSFESFKESGGIEYSVDALIGLQLKITGRENWDAGKDKNKKRNEINEAKSKYPREIELVILKNRMYKAWNKIELAYYPDFDYFEETSKEFIAVRD